MNADKEKHILTLNWLILWGKITHKISHLRDLPLWLGFIDWVRVQSITWQVNYDPGPSEALLIASFGDQ